MHYPCPLMREGFSKPSPLHSPRSMKAGLTSLLAVCMLLIQCPFWTVLFVLMGGTFWTVLFVLMGGAFWTALFVLMGGTFWTVLFLHMGGESCF